MQLNIEFQGPGGPGSIYQRYRADYPTSGSHLRIHIQPDGLLDRFNFRQIEITEVPYAGWGISHTVQ